MTDAPTRAGLLGERDFIRYLTARCLGTLAVQMQTVAVGWQVYQTTRDPLHLGFIGLSQFLPFIVLILPAGHVADSFDRRRIVTGCYFLNMICALSLLTLSLRGVNSVTPIFALMTLLGITRAFAMPAAQALIPNLVPPQSFARAVAVNQSVFQVSTIVGPTLGGVLYLAGASVVYGIVATLLFTSTLLMLRIRSGGRSASVAPAVSVQSLLSGLRFVKSKPIVLGAISLDLFAVLFGGATALLPVYAHDILHTSSAGLGLLRTAPAVGAMICALALAAKPLSRHVGAWMFGGVTVFGIATIVFGLSTNLAVSMVALTLLGAGDMVSVYLRHLLVQLETPDAIRGRVSAVNAVFVGASNELGEFESGVTAAWFGTVRAVVVGGAATLIVAAVWSRLFPELRSMDRLPTAAR
ncbi:MFS family permease [Povalibacter uvarum]|uniref:MFS family permease n=1 Tax=Povalibacter uvarum TaxID=732238 RepID=A0A841HV36_9GAMM|nr:MFS transporter [Povalibacter uvarum]MBB6096524.1 MFS family permease [Povalibacter uvarum]